MTHKNPETPNHPDLDDLFGHRGDDSRIDTPPTNAEETDTSPKETDDERRERLARILFSSPTDRADQDTLNPDTDLPRIYDDLIIPCPPPSRLRGLLLLLVIIFVILAGAYGISVLVNAPRASDPPLAEITTTCTASITFHKADPHNTFSCTLLPTFHKNSDRVPGTCWQHPSSSVLTYQTPNGSLSSTLWTMNTICPSSPEQPPPSP